MLSSKRYYLCLFTGYPPTPNGKENKLIGVVHRQQTASLVNYEARISHNLKHLLLWVLHRKYFTA